MSEKELIFMKRIVVIILAAFISVTILIIIKPEYTHQVKAENRTRTVGNIVFVKIPAGCFQMGNPNTTMKHTNDERPVHKVCLSSYWMARYETTQKQYMTIMGANPTERKGDNLPVGKVNWWDCRAFSEKFSDLYKVKASLPTEAQWEYAARAGTSTLFYWGNKLDENYVVLTGTIKPVGTKRPNAWGLYDMSGNVQELCLDRYEEDYYSKSPVNNPLNRFTDKYSQEYVSRGGCSFGHDYDVTSFDRSTCGYFFCQVDSVGFRIVINE